MNKPYIIIPVSTVLRLVLLAAFVVALVALLVLSDGDPATAEVVGSAAFLF